MRAKKLKIIRTIESFYPYVTGPANQVSKISSELKKRGISSPIVTTEYHAEKSKKAETIDGVSVTRLPIRSRFLKYLVTPEIEKHLDDFDIIHAHGYRSYQTEKAFCRAKTLGKPFVISTHGMLLGYSRHLKGAAKLPYVLYDLFKGKKIVKNADAVIVNSKKELRDALLFGIDKKRTHLIPVGIYPDQYKPANKNDGTLRILLVARLSRNRNVEPLIHAAAILKKKLKGKRRFTVTIVGGEAKSSDTSKKGYVEELKELSKTLGVSDIVRFAGERKDAALREEHRTADIFVYTSLSENFGQTILEAGAAGLPIICTDVGIAPEIITNGKNGFIVKGEPNEIAQRLYELLDKKKRQRFGDMTRDIVRKNFDWDNIMNQYVKMYKSLIKK